MTLPTTNPTKARAGQTAIAAAQEQAQRAGIGTRARFAVADAFDPATWPAAPDQPKIVCGTPPHPRDIASPRQGGWLAWADAVVLELMSIASGLEMRRRKRQRAHHRAQLSVLDVPGVPSGRHRPRGGLR